jgi:hypothetical protein
MTGKYYIGLHWFGEIDAKDLELISSIVKRTFEGELPTFTLYENHLCVVLDKQRIGLWGNTESSYFDALVQLGLIRSWKLFDRGDI